MTPVSELIAPEVSERDLATEALRCAYHEMRATLLHDDDRAGRRRVLNRLSEALERLGAHPAHDFPNGLEGPSDISDWSEHDFRRRLDEEQERDKLNARERSW